MSLFPTLIAQLSDIRQIGVRTGSAMAVMSFGGLTGSPIGGAIMGSSGDGNWLGLQLFCGLCMAASAVFYSLSRGKLVGFWNIKVKV